MKTLKNLEKIFQSVFGKIRNGSVPSTSANPGFAHAQVCADTCGVGQPGVSNVSHPLVDRGGGLGDDVRPDAGLAAWFPGRGVSGPEGPPSPTEGSWLFSPNLCPGRNRGMACIETCRGKHWLWAWPSREGVA